jgi:hypothetical protein
MFWGTLLSGWLSNVDTMKGEAACKACLGTCMYTPPYISIAQKRTILPVVAEQY